MVPSVRPPARRLRVVLVQPPHRDTFGYSMPPLGLLHTGAVALARGHDVAVLDLALLARRGELTADATLAERCADAILGAGPDALGVGAMLSAMPAALDLLARVRARAPGLPIVLGGQGPETIEEHVLARHPALDAVAVGEADETLADWLDALAAAPTPRAGVPASASVPGLVVRGRDGRPRRTPPRPLLAPLDRVAPPAWDLAEPPGAYARAAGEAAALFPIDLGRGCGYRCSFCTTPVFWGRSARHLSAARAADELDRLAALGDVERAYVTHDLFTFDRDAVLAICAEKRRRGNALPWECRTRIDLVDRELLEAMAGAGCERILYGVESAVPAVLARVDKGGRARRTDVLETLRVASDVGVASIVGTMAGVPGETLDDVEANLELMARAAVLDGTSLSLHWFNVTPGNGRAAEVGDALRLVPGVCADLVRGHDLPVGFVPEPQRRLVEQDARTFAAFRVFVEGGVTPHAQYALTRNAHVLLEVFPRTLRALARASGSTLRATLLAFLGEVLGTHGPRPPASRARGSAPRPAAASGPAEPTSPSVLLSREDDALARALADVRWPLPWSEAFVLAREHAVRHLGAWARARGDSLATSLAYYEEALFGTEEPQVQTFPADPLALVRAMDTGSWPPLEPPGERAVLFVREGDLVRSFALSDFLADVADGHDDATLAALWPDVAAPTLARARARLLALCADEPLPALRPWARAGH